MLFIVCSAPFSSLQLPAVRDVLLPSLLPAPRAAFFQPNLVVVEAQLDEGEEGLGRRAQPGLCAHLRDSRQAKLCVPAVLPAQGWHSSREMGTGALQVG